MAVLDLPYLFRNHAHADRVLEGEQGRELLQGLEGDLCQSPHWGYMIKGQLTVTFSDGNEERPVGGDLFYWPPGHTVKAVKDAEIVLFSPQHEHVEVVDHLAKQLVG